METEEVIVLDSDSENPTNDQTPESPDKKPDETDKMDTSELLNIKNDATIAEERKNEGNNQYKAQNYKLALKCYSDAIQLAPENASYRGNRAACYIMLSDYQAALADARESVRLDPKFEKGFVRIAKCCLAMGDLIGTEQAIKKFLELDPTNQALKSEIQNLRQLRELEQSAYKSYEKEDYRTCVYHMDGALKIAPASRKYQLLKAECLAMLGRLSEAGDIAITIMQRETSNSDAIFVRGLTLYYGDNLDKGIIHFERTLALDPDHKKAKVWRQKAKSLKEKKEKGNELFKNLKYRDALAMYNEALEIDPLNKDTNSKLYYNRALVNTKLGNLNDAVKDCNEALKINEKYLKALLKRAKCYYDLENFEECVKDYENALKLEKTTEIKNLLRDAKLQLKKSKRKDYYKILGVSKDASDTEIKKAYRKRALVHHPDRHANASDAEKKEQEIKFKEVGEAYAILSDPTKKSRYDSGQDLDETMGEGFDPSQLYRQFFFADTGSPFGAGGSNFTFSFG